MVVMIKTMATYGSAERGNEMLGIDKLFIYIDGELLITPNTSSDRFLQLF